MCLLFIPTEKKRRVYDQYGKDGLLGHNERQSSRSRRYHQDDDYDYGGFGFTFRDPEDVFREFFGNSPFADIFGGEWVSIGGEEGGTTNYVFISGMYTNGHSMNGNGAGRRNGSSRNGHNSLEAQFFSPFGGLQLMDSFFGAPAMGNGGFSSFSTLSSFGAMNGGGGGCGNGAVKRTSTSTTFVNGKKLVTKRCVVGFVRRERVLTVFFAFLAGCLRTERRR